MKISKVFRRFLELRKRQDGRDSYTMYHTINQVSAHAHQVNKNPSVQLLRPTWPSLPVSSFHAGGYLQQPANYSTSFNVPCVPTQTPHGYGVPGRPRPEHGMYVVTLLKFCDPRVSKCYGCRQSLKPSSLILPPKDMVIVSKQFRNYFKDGQECTSSQASMVYFHSELPCIQLFARAPYLTRSMPTVPSDVLPHLLEPHKRLLREMFQIPI